MPQKAQTARGEVRTGGQRIGGIVEAIEQCLELGPHAGFARSVGRTSARPSQRFTRGVHAIEIGQDVRARPDDDRFAKSVELGTRAFVERDLHGVHRFERGSETTLALAGTARHGGHFAERFGEQGDDGVGLGVRNDAYDERA
jgi:hypothetical protein